MVEHGPRHCFEVGVEDLHELLLRHAVRDQRKAAEIAEPDHRADALHRMAVDLADKHVAAGVRADVGLEQRPRDIERRARLDCEGKSRQRARDLLQLIVVEPARHVGRAGEEDALQRIETRVANVGRSALRSDAVSSPPKRTMRAAYSVMPTSRNSSSSWNWSGSPVSSRLRSRGFIPAAEVVDRAPHVRFAFLVGAPSGKRLRFESRGTPDVAARAMPRVQRADDHVEATRRKPGVDDAPAEAVDQFLERHAAQSRSISHSSTPDRSRGGGRRRSGGRCFDDVGRRLRSISASGGTRGRRRDRPRDALAQCLRSCRTPNGCRGRSGSAHSLPPLRRAT